MRIDVMTLFPAAVEAMLHESILGRAEKKGLLDINCIQIRDYTENKQMQVDDYPYGGGWGCVMMAQPLKSCLEALLDGAPEGERRRVIYLSPQGKPFTQADAKRLQADYDRLVLVCGHYEGVDERFIEQCVDEEISLGDFVLTGGEIAAMAVCDAVCRLVPGVLSDEACYTGESHWDGLLEYPQYTRPEVWEGQSVPKVLLGGNHAEVERWRRKEQLRRTRERRPDLFAAFTPADKTDRTLLTELEKEGQRQPLTGPVVCRRAEEGDLPAMLSVLEEARALLRRRGVDQWQGVYPNEAALRAFLESGELYVLTHGGELGALFRLSGEPEPDYPAITDGKWGSEEPYATLHTAAVAEKYRGTGLAEMLVAGAEKRTLAMGRRWLRADTHKRNKAMQALLRRCGFRYRGNVVLGGIEEDHDPRRMAYEKRIKKE